MKTIAAVIVNHNYERYVADAIESALAQTDPFDEIVVVDDGSTDGSAAVIAGYADRVRIVSKPNGGQLSASLAGLEVVQSDYVYILDSDDMTDVSMVASIRDLLSRDPAKVQFQLSGMDADRKPLHSTFPTFPHGYDAETARRDNAVDGMYIYPPTSGNVYRRATLAALDFDRLAMNEPVDGSPALAMPYLGAVLSVDRPLGFYRVHNASFSQWSRPDVALLLREIARFEKRWGDVCAFAGLSEPPFGKRTPLFVLQRRLMIAALTSEGSVATLALQYVRGMPASSRGWKQKAMLMAWAMALIAPIPSLRSFLILTLRSPVNRPKWMKLGRTKSSQQQAAEGAG